MGNCTTVDLAHSFCERLNRKPVAIYSLTCVIGFILFFAYNATSSILNDDGINYIYAAHALAEGLPEQAKSYRPEVHFYTQITFISSLTSLSLHSSAQLLSLFWQSVLACGFIAIVRIFDNSRQTLLIALAVFFSMNSLNHLRPDIIRGFGFWALQLWAVWASLKFIQLRRWHFALLWLALTCSSIFYRAEGIAYLLSIPIFILLSVDLSANKSLKIARVMFLIAGVTGLLLYANINPPAGSSSEFNPAASFSATEKWQRELVKLRQGDDNFKQLKTAITEIMPTKWAQRSVNDLLIGGFIFHLVVTLIKTTNTPLLVLSLYHRKIKRPVLSCPRHKLLAAYILVGISVGLLSVYNKYFVSPRYIMLTAILLTIPATLVLSQTYRRLCTSHKANERLWKYCLIALPLLVCLYPLGHQNNDKLYLQAAGEWVKIHLEGEQGIYFNEQKVAFYSADYANDSFKRQHPDIQSLLGENYQYAVLYEREVKIEPSPLQQDLNAYRLKTFNNSRGRSVNIYKLPAPGS